MDALESEYNSLDNLTIDELAAELAEDAGHDAAEIAGWLVELAIADPAFRGAHTLATLAEAWAAHVAEILPAATP